MGKRGRPTGIRKIYTDEEREQYRQNHRFRVKSKYQLDWKSLMNRRLYAALQSGKLVSITIDDVLSQLEKQNYLCYYTGSKLELDSPKFKTPSIDRLDSSKGYEPDNVVICLWCVNKAKSNSTESEFIEMCQLVSNWQSNKTPQKFT